MHYQLTKMHTKAAFTGLFVVSDLRRLTQWRQRTTILYTFCVS